MKIKYIVSKIFVFIYNLILAVLLLTVIIVGGALLPLPNNYKIYSVMSGSMEPQIKTGSIVLVKPEKDYQIKDIVTMKTRDPKKTLTHRIITKITTSKQTLYETKGDANKKKDADLVLPVNIIGKVVFALPYLGYPISYSKTVPGLIFLIVIPATVLIYTELMNIKNEALRLIQERKKRKLTAFEKVEEKVGEEIIAVEKLVRRKKK